VKNVDFNGLSGPKVGTVYGKKAIDILSMFICVLQTDHMRDYCLHCKSVSVWS
jgi:hypothetical protein